MVGQLLLFSLCLTMGWWVQMDKYNKKSTCWWPPKLSQRSGWWLKAECRWFSSDCVKASRNEESIWAEVNHGEFDGLPSAIQEFRSTNFGDLSWQQQPMGPLSNDCGHMVNFYCQHAGYPSYLEKKERKNDTYEFFWWVQMCCREQKTQRWHSIEAEFNRKNPVSELLEWNAKHLWKEIRIDMWHSLLLLFLFLGDLLTSQSITLVMGYWVGIYGTSFALCQWLRIGSRATLEIFAQTSRSPSFWHHSWMVVCKRSKQGRRRHASEQNHKGR